MEVALVPEVYITVTGGLDVAVVGRHTGLAFITGLLL
jgi:hypothetical protein